MVKLAVTVGFGASFKMGSASLCACYRKSMKVFVGFLLAALVLAGCGSSEEKESVSIASFYKKLNAWIDDPSAARAACAEVAPAEINRSKRYAQVITDGDTCQAALEENFSFLIADDEYKLLAIEPFGPRSEEKKVDRPVELQAVRVRIQTPDGPRTVTARAAAILQNNKIANLAGMRLSTIAPAEFAASLGSDQAIPVDPVSATYYSNKDS